MRWRWDSREAGDGVNGLRPTEILSYAVIYWFAAPLLAGALARCGAPVALLAAYQKYPYPYGLCTSERHGRAGRERMQDRNRVRDACSLSTNGESEMNLDSVIATARACMSRMPRATASP